MIDTNNFIVTFVETKVNVGNYSESSIEVQKKLHSKAGSALLAAVAMINDLNQNQSTQVNKRNTNQNISSPKNAVSARAELTLEQCLKLCDRIERSANTKAYVEKREIYLSQKRQYGDLRSLNPGDRASAMRALKDSSYSYFKIDTSINLPKSIYLKRKNSTSRDKLGETIKKINALTCHKICGINEYPTVDDVKHFISIFLKDEKIHWIKDEDLSSSKLDSEIPLFENS